MSGCFSVSSVEGWSLQPARVDYDSTNFKVSWTTCEGKNSKFGVMNCVYLGHAAGEGTERLMDGKIKVVRYYTKYHIKKEVQAFLGLQLLLQVIALFSTITTPLMEITTTKKNKEKEGYID